MNDHDARELIPAYTLGALDAEEAALLEAYLAANPALRDEVEALRATVRELSFAAPAVRPPEALKERLLARVQAPAAEPLVFPTTRTRPGRPWLPLAAALAAALVIAILSANLFGVSNQLRAATAQNQSLTQQLADAQANADELRRARDQLVADLEAARRNQEQLVSDLSQARAQIGQLQRRIDTDERVVTFLSGPDLASRNLRGTGEAPAAAGTMFMRPGDRDAVVLVSGLPPLESGQSYQFWLASGPLQYNAGVLTLADDGSAYLLVRAPVEVNRFGQVMVTVEQAAEPVRQPAETTVLEGSL
jgi:anti-sigma factor RsiW